VDAVAPCRLDRFGAAVDVLGCRTRQAADHRVLGALGDLAHRRKVAFRSDREAGLDDVDAHVVQELGDRELLFVRHGRAWALLAVAQGRVEYDDAVLVGLGLGGHRIIPSRRMRRFGQGALWVSALAVDPPSAQALEAQPALRGG
jgi:hypothetical protein